MGEIDISLVEDDDFTRVDIGAQLVRPLGFMLGGGVHAGRPRQLGHQMRRNEVANLAQQGELAGGRLVSSLIFHALPCGRAQTRKPTFFLQPLKQ
jgi:hypothetical protein